MDSVYLAAGLAAVIAGVVTSIMVPLVCRASMVLRWVDVPTGRKQHATAVPRLGGLAIAAGLAFGAGAVGLMMWNEWGPHIPKSDLGAVIVACAMVFVAGLVDDIVGLGVLERLLVEAAAAALIVGVGWGFTVLRLPSGRDLPLGAAGAP